MSQFILQIETWYLQQYYSDENFIYLALQKICIVSGLLPRSWNISRILILNFLKELLVII